MYFALAAATWAAVLVAACPGDAAARRAAPLTTATARIRPAMRMSCPRMRSPFSLLVAVGEREVDELALAPDDERIVRRPGETHVVDPGDDRLAGHAGPARAR